MANIDSEDYQAGYDHGQNYVLSKSKHNGWSNYETWAVSLWIDNDEGSQSYWAEAAEEAKKENHDDHSDDWSEATGALADRLKSELEEAAPDLGATLWSDLLNAALSEVNWYEIAEHLLED